MRKPDLVQTGNTLAATTPGAWEEAMQPAVKDVRVLTVQGGEFSGQVTLFRLPRTALFSLKMPNVRVMVPDGRDFVSVNTVSNGRAAITRPGPRRDLVPGNALVLSQDGDFDFATDGHVNSLTVCFYEPQLQAYARKFNGPDRTQRERFEPNLSLESPAGGGFSRYLRFVWAELIRGSAFLQSRNATEEIEDSLWALFLYAAQREDPGNGHRRDAGYAAYTKPAEEFILGHLQGTLRLVDVAAAVGISVPTLNRAFRKLHGIGPKAFIKQRRLDGVRSELLRADPGQTTVTETATKYAFGHLSQFAADYRKQFGELPSQTLRRQNA